jgi:hypothetical protein
MRLPSAVLMLPFNGELKNIVEFTNRIGELYVTSFRYSILIWDNGSNDKILNDLYNSISKHITIVKREKKSDTIAYMDMIEAGKSINSDYLIICDPSVKLYPGALFSAVSRVQSNDEIAAVGGKILYKDKISDTGTVLKNSDIIVMNSGEPKNSANFPERRLWLNNIFTLYNLNTLRKHNIRPDTIFSSVQISAADLLTNLYSKGHTIMYESRAIIDGSACKSIIDQELLNLDTSDLNKYTDRWKGKFETPYWQF